MKLHLPKLLLTAVGAAICCVHQAEADTYYLNVADSNGAALSSGVANTSGGSNIANAWKELCSKSDSYHGPHKLVIDQARTATNFIKLDFNPLTVASLEVAEAASGTWISNSGTREYHIGSTDATQTSVFHGDLKLQGTGTKLVADQTWDIDEGVTVTLVTGTVTTVPGAAWTLSGKGKLDASAATVINLGDTVYNSADTTIDFGSATVKIESYDILKAHIMGHGDTFHHAPGRLHHMQRQLQRGGEIIGGAAGDIADGSIRSGVEQAGDDFVQGAVAAGADDQLVVIGPLGHDLAAAAGAGGHKGGDLVAVAVEQRDDLRKEFVDPPLPGIGVHQKQKLFHDNLVTSMVFFAYCTHYITLKQNGNPVQEKFRIVSHFFAGALYRGCQFGKI